MYIFKPDFMDSVDISLVSKGFMLDQLSQLVWYPSTIFNLVEVAKDTYWRLPELQL